MSGVKGRSGRKTWIQQARDEQRILRTPEECRTICRGTKWESIRRQVLIRDDWMCHICNRKIDHTISGRLPGGATIDHTGKRVEQCVGMRVVDAKIALLDVNTLRAAHMSCNASRNRNKTTNTLDEILADIPAPQPRPTETVPFWSDDTPTTKVAAPEVHTLTPTRKQLTPYEQLLADEQQRKAANIAAGRHPNFRELIEGSHAN